ncbi:hypothetical protein F8388_015312 [Cannabis sativa]|uniref:UBA domain-containing protein n=1 Tax=Cannabis sativa TaxID=3483 RepID=A0A7J6F1N7_CANSA|nr:hypothetical protein F8388_015312 [Cannabis sativa]
MNGGPSGFNNAPVTRTFVIASALFTIFFGMQGRSNNLGLSYLDIFGKFRIWKLIVSAFAFSSTPELMFGLYLLYYFRVFERQIGSNKYSVFILFSLTVSLLLEVLALSFLKDPAKNLITSGPYGLIFASFVPFFFDIPVSTRFTVFNVHFSDKSFIYLAGLQVKTKECVVHNSISFPCHRNLILTLSASASLSSWKRSILPGACGILAGILYRLNIFRIRKAKLVWVHILFNSQSLLLRCFQDFLGHQRGIYLLLRVEEETYHHLQVAQSRQRNYPPSIPSAVEPSEDSIATLVSMGFDRNNARQALVQARNDVNVATNILLEAQSH